MHSRSISEVLDNQLSAEARAGTVDGETMISDTNNCSSKLQEQFKQPSDSTIIRTGGQTADNIGVSQDANKKRRCHASR